MFFVPSLILKILLGPLYLLFLLGVLALVAVSLASFATQQHQVLELLSHFRYQYVLLLAICLIPLLLMRKKGWSTVVGVALVVNMMPLAPFFFPQQRPDPASASLKVMQMNMLATNDAFDKISAVVAEQDPDVVAVEEVRPSNVHSLTQALRKYPYRKIVPEKTAFGVALFSKRPLKNVRVVSFGQGYGMDKRKFPSILADTDASGRLITLLVTHPLPPLSGFQERNRQLADIAEYCAKLHRHMIVLGDLNISPWSSYFHGLLNSSGLKDTALGFGVQGTWPTYVPWFKIPIDHVLVSQELSVISREVGRDIGSDHLPVVVKLALPEK